MMSNVCFGDPGIPALDDDGGIGSGKSLWVSDPGMMTILRQSLSSLSCYRHCCGNLLGSSSTSGR